MAQVKPQYIIFTLLAFSMYWMYLLYQPFLLSIMIASLLAISTVGLQRRLEEKSGSILVASLLSTIVLALLFFAPLGYFLTTFTIELTTIKITHLEKVYIKLNDWAHNLPSYLSFLQPYAEESLKELEVKDLAAYSLSLAAQIGKYSANFLKTAMLIIIFYFFSLYYGKTIFDYIKRVVQLPQQDATLLSFELSSMMSVVFYSILTTAVFEGALFGVAVAFMGYNGLLFGILYGFASLLPIVGGALMWIPFMVYELSIGHTGSAIFIVLYSIIVISIIADTIIKPVIIKEINLRIVNSEGQKNEILIFFSIVAGLGAFGFWGMILGPAITAFFLALLKLIEQHQKLRG